MAKNSMIYEPVMTCTEEDYSKMWEACQKANTEHLEEIEKKAIAAGGILYRFLYESVADGKAVYQVIKVNKTTARVRLCVVDGCFADYVVPQWGNEATVSLDYVKKGIEWQDAWRKMTAKA